MRIAGGGPHALVVEQGLVEDHRQVVAERRHASDREPGGRAHLVGARLAYLGAVEGLRKLVGVDPVAARRDAHDRIAIGHEHDRLGDLGLVAADRYRRVADRAGGFLEPLHADLEPERPGAGGDPVPHASMCSVAPPASAVSLTPATSASSASDARTSSASSSRSQSMSKSPTSPKLMRPS